MSVSSYAAPMRSLMGQTVTVEARSGVTGNNTPLYGAARTFACSVMSEERLMLNAQGQQVVASGQVMIYPVASDGTFLTTLRDTDRITLPDGTQPVVHSITQVFDQFGKIVIYTVWT